jgi:hypothetical protein
MHWTDKLGHMRHETWEKQAKYKARREYGETGREYSRDNFEHHAEWRDGQVHTMRKLRALEDENRQLKDRKLDLEVQLKHKSPTGTQGKQSVLETDGLFGRKTEKEWKKEYERLEEIDRVRFQDERLWRADKPHVLDKIAKLKAKNEILRAEIKVLEDELERLTSMSTNLYFHRPEQRHTLGALGWRAALVWRL